MRPPPLCPHCEAAVGLRACSPPPTASMEVKQPPFPPPPVGAAMPSCAPHPPVSPHTWKGWRHRGDGGSGGWGGSRGGGRRVGEVISPPGVGGGGGTFPLGPRPFAVCLHRGWSPGGDTTPSRCAAISGRCPLPSAPRRNVTARGSASRARRWGGGRHDSPHTPLPLPRAHPEPHVPFWGGGLAHSKHSQPPQVAPARRCGDTHRHPITPHPRCALEGSAAPWGYPPPPHNSPSPLCSRRRCSSMGIPTATP